MTRILDPLSGVTTFVAVAELKSFSAAARKLAVSTTAVSKAIGVLERRYGIALFQRTTRQVALTEAGAALFRRLRPVSTEMTEAFDELESYRERPVGTLRVTMPRSSAMVFLEPLVPVFRRDYPDVTLEVSVDDAFVDLVADGYDAGIRLGESVAKDMVALRLTPEITWSIVGSPTYLARAGRPRSPEELLSHEAIRYRFPGSRILHRWGFQRDHREFIVDVTGGLIVDDRTALVSFARQGLGLAYVSDLEVRLFVGAGLLEPLLQHFIPSDLGLYLYFPKRSQSQLKLRAFIDALRSVAAQPAFLDAVLGVPFRKARSMRPRAAQRR